MLGLRVLNGRVEVRWLQLVAVEGKVRGDAKAAVAGLLTNLDVVRDESAQAFRRLRWQSDVAQIGLVAEDVPLPECLLPCRKLSSRTHLMVRVRGQG